MELPINENTIQYTVMTNFVLLENHLCEGPAKATDERRGKNKKKSDKMELRRFVCEK